MGKENKQVKRGVRFEGPLTAAPDLRYRADQIPVMYLKVLVYVPSKHFSSVSIRETVTVRILGRGIEFLDTYLSKGDVVKVRGEWAGSDMGKIIVAKEMRVIKSANERMIDSRFVGEAEAVREEAVL